MKKFLASIAIVFCSLPSVGFALEPDDFTGVDDAVKARETANSATQLPPAATNEVVNKIADANDAASAAENSPS
jgi:hypothetical protein